MSLKKRKHFLERIGRENRNASMHVDMKLLLLGCNKAEIEVVVIAPIADINCKFVAFLFYPKSVCRTYGIRAKWQKRYE